MQHTKEQLQAISDFEVNKTLAAIIYGYPEDKDIAKRINSGAIDFCNTPNDIMPLAFERGIGLAPNKDSWEAFTLEDNYQVIQNQFVDGSPLRAIACCLILVLQEKQNERQIQTNV